MPQRQQHIAEIGQGQTVQHQADDFDIGCNAVETVKLRPGLQRFAAVEEAFRAGVQHRAGIAQAVDALIGRQQVGVDARHLRRDVSADAELAAADLVYKADGFQGQSRIDMGQQRIAVLHQRGMHEFVAVRAEQCQ